MFGKKNTQEQAPGRQGGWCAVGTLASSATAQVNNSGAGDTAEPRDETEGSQPRADRVGSPWDWSSAAGGNLESIGSQLDPVVDEEAASCKWPSN
ncbi:hypothetical protein HG530_010164 [Fusarium avenaceum]|nr:hypothetical protein HG530_010164 [Fusarium avenaceum]